MNSIPGFSNVGELINDDVGSWTKTASVLFILNFLVNKTSLEVTVLLLLLLLLVVVVVVVLVVVLVVVVVVVVGSCWKL